MMLSPSEQSDLERAVGFLEQPRLAIRLANYAGKPLDGALSAIPKLNGAVHNALRGAIMQCLTVAIEFAGGRDVRAVRMAAQDADWINGSGRRPVRCSFITG